MFNKQLVEDYIKANGLTREEFAERCGMSLKVLNRVMAGTERLWMAKVVRIGEVIGVTPNELLLR